jgi:D-sedoheptulose 7-phosphate isomerase
MEYTFIKQYLRETKEIVERINIFEIKKAVDLIYSVAKKKGRIFFLGVGGSAGNASHAVNDFRKILNIESYTPVDNVSELTATINDNGWRESFVNFLKISNLNKNDLIFIFSVGGGNLKKKVSINIVSAIDYAFKKKVKILSIVGRDGGYAKKFSNACILIPTINKMTVTPHSEEAQAIIWHLLVTHPKLKKHQTKWESYNK